MTAAIIIPTTGSHTVVDAVKSVLNQSYNTIAYVVVDGSENEEKLYVNLGELIEHPNYFSNTRLVVLPDNVGANGFYGHRVYAAFTHLINSDYVLYLDQDCFLDKDHVKSMIHTIEENNLDWCHSLRKIVNKEGEYICNDDCESLGKYNPVMQYNHVDTNCYCIKTSIATKISQVWHGGWGQDRVFYSALSQHFSKFDCTGKYTLNYRIEGNSESVKSDFFEQWNQRVNELFNGQLPWRKSK
jgi:glycosyltransferase involved in cell wall biosynthesis